MAQTGFSHILAMRFLYVERVMFRGGVRHVPAV